MHICAENHACNIPFSETRDFECKGLSDGGGKIALNQRRFLTKISAYLFIIP